MHKIAIFHRYLAGAYVTNDKCLAFERCVHLFMFKRLVGQVYNSETKSKKEKGRKKGTEIKREDIKRKREKPNETDVQKKQLNYFVFCMSITSSDECCSEFVNEKKDESD